MNWFTMRFESAPDLNSHQFGVSLILSSSQRAMEVHNPTSHRGEEVNE
jgi:hypothetical protein